MELEEGDYVYCVDDIKYATHRETEFAPSHWVYTIYITIYDGKNLIKSEFDLHLLDSQMRIMRRFSDNVGLYKNTDYRFRADELFKCIGLFGYAHFFENGIFAKFLNDGEEYWG